LVVWIVYLATDKDASRGIAKLGEGGRLRGSAGALAAAAAFRCSLERRLPDDVRLILARSPHQTDTLSSSAQRESRARRYIQVSTSCG
jgi:hypothetical protein